jgi:hypothetical protein|eukprot:g557.t1
MDFTGSSKTEGGDRDTESATNVENPENVLKNLSFGGEITINGRYLDMYVALKPLRDILAMHVLFVSRCIRRAIMLRGSKRSFKLGVIGCGQNGSHVVDKILEAGISTSSVCISTRRPEEGRGRYLQEKYGEGLVIQCDNVGVAKVSRLLLLACTPAQMSTVAASLRGKLKSSTLVCSMVIGFSAKKVQAMLQSHVPVVKIGVGGNGSELASEFMGAKNVEEQVLIAANQLIASENNNKNGFNDSEAAGAMEQGATEAGQFQKILKIQHAVTSLCHAIRPTVRNHEIDSMEDGELKEKLLANAAQEALNLSRQSGALAVLGNSGASVKGQPNEASETIRRYRESYVDSIV